MSDKKTIKIELRLTDKEIELLRNSTSDLGTSGEGCASLQLQIANALLDVGWQKPNKVKD